MAGHFDTQERAYDSSEGLLCSVPHMEDLVFGRAISDEVYSISLSLTKTQKPFVLYELMLLEVNCIHASYK